MQAMSRIGAVNFFHMMDVDTLKFNYPREKSADAVLSVNLMDARGDEVKVPIVIKQVTDHSIEITIRNRPTGIFYLKIQDGISYILKKIILQ